MEECEPRVVGYEIYLDPLIRLNVNYIFHDARCPSTAYLYYFKAMPV
jgi:hypothetical protein